MKSRNTFSTIGKIDRGILMNPRSILFFFFPGPGTGCDELFIELNIAQKK
jgi:hypothetical protein